jgi:hypothetical protein
MIRARLLLALAFAVSAILVPPSAWAARPLALGFSDSAFTGPEGAFWLQRSASAGAGYVRINIGWPAPNTPAKPAGFDARNPADPHYNFTAADAAIRRASALGLRILANFTGAPEWAEGPGIPPGAPPGSWRPDLGALRDYAIALGRRYSGRFPDPANPGHTLPRVAAFQVWNEPNLNQYLNPQWVGTNATAPTMYRAMLNAFYAGLKSVDPSALVVTAGTAPFGDPEPDGARIMPALFWRDVLCLRKTSAGGLAGTACPDPAHFDVLAHDMYSWGSPSTHALWPDDVAIPDVGKLTRVLRAAERTGRALPRLRHPLWITEVGYNSKPPNPFGVPVARQANWLAETLAELWREGASAVFWEQVGDQPPVPNYGTTSQSGVYYLDGQPKPALAAFRFPLVAWRTPGSSVDVWGRSPARGRLEIQEKAGARWRTLRVISVGRGSTFLERIGGTQGTELRARVVGDASRVWRTH